MDNINEIKKSGGKEIAVGFDLTDTYSQISFGRVDGEDVDTLSMIQGGASYLIQTALFRRREVNQWYAGVEAVKNIEADGYYVDKLLSKAASGEEIVLGTEHYRPSALIALFMRRVLSLLNVVEPINRISSFMITVDSLDNNMAKVLAEAVASLNLTTTNVFFQSHMESFYYYNIYQPTELWNHSVLLLDFCSENLKALRFECNRKTTPVVALIDPFTYSSFRIKDAKTFIPDTAEAKEVDAKLLEIVEELVKGRILSAVYFIGENFSRDVYKESLKFLCMKGRAFEGNNLFSKGACFAAKNKIHHTILSDSHVFLGNDRLKANVGINVLNRGTAEYLPLLDAGTNWFEAKKDCTLILNQGNRVSFVVTPMTGKNPEVVDITLGDLPKRPPKTTRLSITVKMQSESKMEVRIKDLGFGELFPAANLEWNEVINI